MWERVSEEQWRSLFYAELDKIKEVPYNFVTGPGRSGHVASMLSTSL